MLIKARFFLSLFFLGIFISISSVAIAENSKNEAPITKSNTLSTQNSDEKSIYQSFTNLPLFFPEKIISFYADNKFQLFWQQKSAERAFLTEYALLALSDINLTIYKQLITIHQTTDPLEKDILLSDAFLNYAYYINTLKKQAQNWLYLPNQYQPTLSNEKRFKQWVTILKQGKQFNFIQKNSIPNKTYQATLDKVLQLAKTTNTSPEKLTVLAINLQRLRIIPNFENGIFINIPSYQLHYFRNGEDVLTSKIIVGKLARKTPVMYSKLSDLVINPPWNAPERLINEDLIPKVKKDPSYIYRNGYTIIDYKGNIIDPYTIDWENITSKKFPYRIRQVPSNSALGNFKFNMPSSEAIYLHDTPHRGLFHQKNRALSSGCVRVEKSDELATLLLKEVGWTDDEKIESLKNKKTQSVKIMSNNPVYIYYVTHWVENDKIRTLPDIYSYDKNFKGTNIDLNILRKYLL